MNHRVVWFVSLALACAPALCSASPWQGWSLTAGGGPAWLDEGARFGGGAALGVANPLRPWFVLGVEANLYRFGAPARIASIPEEFTTFADTRLYSLAVTSRFVVPVTAGLAPFLVLRTGYARTDWGSRHVRNPFYGPPEYTVPGSSSTGMLASIGTGLRGRWSRNWPGVEASLDYTELSGRDRGTQVTGARLLLTY